jgi:lysophospholipase L1-like esterase
MYRTSTVIVTPVATAIIISFCMVAVGRAEDSRTARWQSAMKEFERQDERSVFAPGGIVFVGSSSIRRWDLSKSFPGLPVLNRGFGGSQISDVNHFLDRVVLKYKPKTIVFYAGDNDIGAGHSVDRVVKDFKEFRDRVHKELPEARILFLAIKPSPKRWHLAEVQQTANTEIAEICEPDSRLTYIDTWTPLISASQPRPELFAKDKLHLSEAGYEHWTRLVKPFLAE